MPGNIRVIIIDDDPDVCTVLFEIIKRFYVWGEVLAFTEVDKAISYCLAQEMGVAIFVVDVFLGQKTCFAFLDAIQDKFPMAHEDAIVITGQASNEVVNMCVASDITHLLEKPVKPFALQLAVRAIVSKYIKFARKLLQDPAFVENVMRF
jgi:response regulator of citrate/malate metabolism